MKNKKILKIFDFKNKIVIVTGSSGQIGSSIVDFFLSNDSIVCGIDKSLGSKVVLES